MTLAPLHVPASRPRPAFSKPLIGFWVLVLLSLPVWLYFEIPAWDVTVYVNAIHALQAGHDPYADAIAVQRTYHEQAVHPVGDPPWSYVYSPLTLPLLRLIGHLPLALAGWIYWLVFAAAVLAQAWFAITATEPGERRFFLYLAGVAPFFPGFLANGIVIGGNIAYLLYGAMLVTAVIGWRRDRWIWFYLAVLAASCIKAPLLSLVVIPVLSARRQWLPAAMTTAVSLSLFAMQPLLWPDLFRHYLEAVDLQFLFNRDFGCSPAGLFGGFLYDRGLPYKLGSSIFYLAYAIPLFAVLFWLSRRFLRGEFTLQRWVPVLLTGVILLNPRILEYDVAPIALLLALIAWRFFSTYRGSRGAVIGLALVFVASNAIAAISWNVRKLVDCPLLVLFFAAGCWNLRQQSELDPGNRSAATN